MHLREQQELQPTPPSVQAERAVRAIKHARAELQLGDACTPKLSAALNEAEDDFRVQAGMPLRACPYCRHEAAPRDCAMGNPEAECRRLRGE